MPHYSGTLRVEGPHKVPVKKHPRNTVIGIIVGSVLLVGLIGWAGYGINSWTHPAKSVRTNKTFTGKITLMSGDNSAGCVTPDSGGMPSCGPFLFTPGMTLQRDQEVHAADIQIDVKDGGYKAVVIYSLNPH